MKKTIITLLALAGVATAAEHTLTTGIEYNDELYNGYSNPSVAGLTYTHSDWPGTITGNPLSFTIELSSLFGANAIADTDLINLNSLKVKVHPQGWAMDGDRRVTLSVEDNAAYSYEQKIYQNPDNNVVRSGGELTISNINWEGLTKNDTIVFTIDGGSDHSIALASISAGTWKGVSTLDTTGWTKGNNVTEVGNNAAPLVSLAVTTSPNAVPEPATATLSLMALAGLAARRRRK